MYIYIYNIYVINIVVIISFTINITNSMFIIPSLIYLFIYLFLFYLFLFYLFNFILTKII